MASSLEPHRALLRVQTRAYSARQAAALARQQQKRHLGSLYSELVEARRAPKRASEK